MTRVVGADFVGAFPQVSKFPPNPFPEIAFVGRSNVGKSTLINLICDRRKLARVGATPGTTKNGNVFKLKLKDVAAGQSTDAWLVDLPGYGYAKLSMQTKEILHDLLVQYMKKRKQLSLLCLLNDCRRSPSEDERALVQLARDRGCSLLLLLTKADKLNRQQVKEAVKKIAADLDLDAEREVVAFSKDAPALRFWSLPLVSAVLGKVD